MNPAKSDVVGHFGINLDLMFDDFPETEEPFWRDVIFEAQRRVFQSLLPHPPPILFKEPPLGEPFFDNPPWPTDLLGAYFRGDYKHTGYLLSNNKGRRIEIYPKRIAHCSRSMAKDARNKSPSEKLGWDEKDLTMVVVVHELMHALLHTGCFINNDDTPKTTAEGELGKGEGAGTEFLKNRLLIFNRLAKKKDIIELHAQLGTWHLLSNGGRDKTPKGGAAKAFLDLMPLQPPEYIVKADLLNTPPETLWVWMWLARHAVNKEFKEITDNMETFLLKPLSLEEWMNSKNSLLKEISAAVLTEIIK